MPLPPLPPAPDDADAEAELIKIEGDLQQLQQAQIQGQQESSRLLLRAQFLQGVLARSRTHDVPDVTVEGVEGP